MLSKLLSGGDGRRRGIIVPGSLGLLPLAGGGVMRRGIIVPGSLGLLPSIDGGVRVPGRVFPVIGGLEGEGFVTLLLMPFIIYGFFAVNP